MEIISTDLKKVNLSDNLLLDALYTKIFDSIDEVIIFYDAKLQIVRANKKAEEIYNTPADLLRGKICYEIWNEQNLSCISCPVKEALINKKPSNGEIVTPHGTIWNCRAYPIHDEKREVLGVVEFAKEITSSRKIEDALSWMVQVNSCLAELSSSLLSSLSIDDIPNLILETAQNLTNSKFGFIGYIEEETGYFVSPTLTREIWSSCDMEDKSTIFKKFGGLWGWVLKNRKSLYTNTPENDFRSAGVPVGHIPIKNFIAAPALIEEKLVGAIFLANSTTDYNDNDLALIERLATIYAIALQRRKTEEALYKINEVLENKVSERTSELENANEMMRQELDERKRIEYELRKKESSLALAQRIANMGNWDWDIETNRLHISEGIYHILKINRKYIGTNYKKFLDFIHHEDKELIISKLNKLMYKYEPQSLYHRIILPNGIERVVRQEAEVFFKNGKAVRITATVQDITESKNSEEELKKSIKSLQIIQDATVNALALTVEKRDPYTAGHLRRVSHLACIIGRQMGLDEEQIEAIRYSGLLHDLGKLFIPTDILSKPGKISNIEMDLIKTHPQVGFEIVKTIPFNWPVGDILLQHHEKINGTGYPFGLMDNQILLEAKILCVADVLEAMASHRPYRPALGIESAMDELVKNQGILYDKTVVDTCIKLYNSQHLSLFPLDLYP